MFLREAAATLLRRTRLPSRYFSATPRSAGGFLPISISRKLRLFHQNDWRGYGWRMRDNVDPRLWIILLGQAAILEMDVKTCLAEDVQINSSANNDEGASFTGLRKIEDGSVISNIHTSKWRVFTDNGREFFLQGKLEEAEKFFLSALQEAREGFGERDPHVASSCNNLAELYRVKKAFDKAEPLYLEAINILEESFGPEDIRVGAAFHNLGQFYLAQRKLEEACLCYERALKIKRRVLGQGNPDYADTMYHLGRVLTLQGKAKDAEALIQDSIRVLEDAGEESSTTYIKRLRYLSQVYIRYNRLAEAEVIQRKILHVMELSKGWSSLETVNAAELLACTLQSSGSLREAREMLERCLEARRTLLPEEHIQICANMLHLARVLVLNSKELREMGDTEAVAELDEAKDLLGNSARIAKNILCKLRKQKGNKKKNGLSGEARRDGHAELVILLQSLDALGLLEINRRDLQESEEEQSASRAFSQCIAAYKEFGTGSPLGDSPEVKSEYLSCLKHFSALLADRDSAETQQVKGSTLTELKEEIRRIEAEVSSQKSGKRHSKS